MIVGIILLICAIAMAVTGFILGDPFDNGALFAVGVVGMFLTVASIGLTTFGAKVYFGRSIANFGAQMINPGVASLTNTIATTVHTSKVAQPPVNDKEQQLRNLDDLKAKGLITEQEYVQMRKNILGL